MSALTNFLTTIYAFLALFPFLAFALFWFLIYIFLKEKKITTRLAMDITTFFLVGSVAQMWDRLFAASFGFWLIILVILISFGLLGGYQNRIRGSANLLKVTRVVWRFSFLFLFAIYFILVFSNIVKYFIFST